MYDRRQDEILLDEVERIVIFQPMISPAHSFCRKIFQGTILTCPEIRSIDSLSTFPSFSDSRGRWVARLEGRYSRAF